MSGPLKVAQNAPEGVIDAEQLTQIGILRERLAGCCGQEADAHKDDFTLLRFLIARNCDLDKTEQMWKGVMQWRESTGVSALFHEWQTPSDRAKYVNRFFYASVMPGTSRDGSPIMVERLGKADLAGMHREKIVDLVVLAYTVYLESAFRAVRQASQDQQRFVRAFVVTDASGASTSTITNIGIIKRVSSIGPANYPEVTQSVSIVRGPTIVAKIYGMVSPLLPEETRSKVDITAGDFKKSLETHIDFHNMPCFLGGEADDAFVCAAEEIPQSAGNQDITTSPDNLGPD